MAITPAKVSVTEGSGKDLDMVQVSTTAGTVEREVVAIGDPDTSTASRYARVTAGGALQTDASATIQPISAASLPLPSGAATAAKQPAPGTAGTASADVLSVQGVSGMTPVDVNVVSSSMGGATAAKQDIGNTAIATLDSDLNSGLGADGAAPPSIAGTGVRGWLRAIYDKLVAGIGVTGTFWQATQPVSAAALPLPSGASTAAKQPAIGAVGTPSADVITVQGATSMTKLLVTPDSVALPLHQSTNIDQIAGTTPDTNSGTKSGGTLRVVIATDQPALTNKLLVTPDLPSGASTAAKQPALGTAGTPSADVITVQGAASMTPLADNLTQLAGNSVNTGNGTSGTGTLRVAIASDQTQLTNALKVDGSAVTQPVKQSPQTSGGCSMATGSIGATATSVKSSAGQVFSIDVYNSNTSPVYLQVFNTATGSVTLGTTAPVLSIGIPAGGGKVLALDSGLAFSTAITIAFTISRAGSGAPSNTVDYNVAYA